MNLKFITTEEEIKIIDKKNDIKDITRKILKQILNNINQKKT